MTNVKLYQGSTMTKRLKSTGLCDFRIWNENSNSLWLRGSVNALPF